MGIQNWVERNGAAPEPAIQQGSPEPVDPNPPDRAEPPPPVAESVPSWLQDVPPLTEEWGFSEPPEADALEPVDPVYGLDWKGLEARVAACERCELCKTRTRTVFGVGDRSADLMVIGEAPGVDEDRQGEPFVGRAGQLLNAMLLAIGLERSQVFIANVLKCRPPGNRDPQPDEVAACRGYLERQIDLVEPRVIVLLGKVAAQTLLGNDLTLSAMRGQWYRVRGVGTRVTYHPAALLRNAGFKRPTWEDMQVVRDRLLESSRG
jgi:DNA polymerase